MFRDQVHFSSVPPHATKLCLLRLHTILGKKGKCFQLLMVKSLCLDSRVKFPMKDLGPTLVEKGPTLSTGFINMLPFQSTTRGLKLYVSSAHFLLRQGNNLQCPKTRQFKLLPYILLIAKILFCPALEGWECQPEPQITNILYPNTST